MDNKIGVFLTGGGARGSFEIGFFKALEELGIEYNAIFGSSVGALIGGAATYMNSNEMFECWKTITLETILHIDSNKINTASGKKRTIKLWRETLKACFNDKFLISIEDTQNLLYQQLVASKIMESPIDFGIMTTKLPNLKLLKVFKKDMTEDNVLDYILASLYLPIFQHERIIDNNNYIDIGAIRRYPIEVLKDYKTIFVVNTDNSPTKITKRIKQANLKTNEVIVVNMEKRPSILDFTEEQSEINLKDGYETTMKILKKHKKV